MGDIPTSEHNISKDVEVKYKWLPPREKENVICHYRSMDCEANQRDVGENVN